MRTFSLSMTKTTISYIIPLTYERPYIGDVERVEVKNGKVFISFGVKEIEEVAKEEVAFLVQFI